MTDTEKLAKPSCFRVTNASRGAVLADQGQAPGMGKRGIGLMGRRSLPEGEALIIRPCNSVVSFFMRFPIDVLFVNEANEICHVLAAMAPWRVSRIVRGSKFVIELPSGLAERTGTQVGDRLEIVSV